MIKALLFTTTSRTSTFPLQKGGRGRFWSLYLDSNHAFRGTTNRPLKIELNETSFYPEAKPENDTGISVVTFRHWWENTGCACANLPLELALRSWTPTVRSLWLLEGTFLRSKRGVYKLLDIDLGDTQSTKKKSALFSQLILILQKLIGILKGCQKSHL